MKKTVLFLSISLLAVSCSNNISSKKELTLQETDEVKSIKMGSDVKLFSMAMFHYVDESGIEYITIENKNHKPQSSAIFFYRLDSCSLYQTVEIAKRGPNTVSGLMGHLVINKDSILLSSVARNKFTLVNSKGEILKEYDFSTDENGNHNRISYSTSLYYTPLVINKGVIYGLQEVTYENEQPNFNNSPLSISIDTATGKVSRPAWHYPKLHEINNRINYNEQFSRIFDGKRFVYSFCVLDSIYTAEVGVTGLKPHVAKSKYMGNPYNSGFARNSNLNDQFSITNTKARYGNIIYDSEHNVYYRFCHYAEEKKNIPQEYIYCHGAFSIIILDGDFNVVGETQFPAGRYAPMLFFVNKEGLWLSENNYERDDRTDDELVFRCLKLSK